MADHTLVNLKEDVEDRAPGFGMTGIESRFAREALQMTEGGITYFRLDPDFRTPFGHKHSEQEEVYVVVSGSARIKIEDEVLDLRQWDAVRVPAGVMRGLEAGPEGAEIVATGAPNTQNKDVELVPRWWASEE